MDNMDTLDEIGTKEKFLEVYFDEVTVSQQAGEELEEDEHTLLDEVEQATDFLQEAGLAELSKIYQQGKEITDHLVNDSVRQRLLTEKQAQTVRSRVRTLNKTLKSRQPRKNKRQDVRNVAWIRDTSTGSRSRSATPDSLDSITHNHHERHDTSASDEEHLPSLLVSDEIDLNLRKNHKRVINLDNRPTTFKSYDKGDVAHLGSENVILKGYHQINSEQGTLKKRLPRQRSGSDPTTEISIVVGSSHLKPLENSHDYISNSNYHSIISSGPPSTDNNLDSLVSNEALSFEGLVLRHQEDSEPLSIMSLDMQNENRVSIDSLSDREYLALKPLLLVEVTAIFDQHKITVLKRKASNKRKSGNNVFSVKLSTLVMRDLPAKPSDTSSMVPQIYRSVLHQLNTRCMLEDGILRVAGQKQKLEMLCAEIEAKFYSNRTQVEQALRDATVHDLTGVLKKLVRDLPDPIFTMELFDMFYKTSAIPNKEDKIHALNLLVLMLPIEHRNTFRLLLQFFNNIVQFSDSNRMNLHNVAMITAPSLFPLRLLSPKNISANANDLNKPVNREMLQKQIRDAAICCGIMDLLLRAGDALWMVPSELAGQAIESQRRRKAQERVHARDAVAQPPKPKKKVHRSKTQYEPGPIISPRMYGRFHDIN